MPWSRATYIKLILQWVAFSADIMTIENLEQASAFGVDSKATKEVLNTHSSVKQCSPLLKILANSQTVAMHLLVLEYLRSTEKVRSEHLCCDTKMAGHCVCSSRLAYDFCPIWFRTMTVF